MLYLYGITDTAHPPEPPPLGLESRVAEVLLLNGMAAVTGELEQGRPEASERHLREHHRVVEAFMASNTVLPVRFGTAFLGFEELQAHFEQAHDAYSSDLRRLRGQIEVSVKVIRQVSLACPFNDAEAGAEIPALAGGGLGTRYVAGKRALAAQNLALQRQQRELADSLMERLAALASQAGWRAIPASSGAAGVSAAFLLPREGLSCFLDAVAALRTSVPGLDILPTGPWPPYSFVSATNCEHRPAIS